MFSSRLMFWQLTALLLFDWLASWNSVECWHSFSASWRQNSGDLQYEPRGGKTYHHIEKQHTSTAKNRWRERGMQSRKMWSGTRIHGIHGSLWRPWDIGNYKIRPNLYLYIIQPQNNICFIRIHAGLFSQGKPRHLTETSWTFFSG